MGESIEILKIGQPALRALRSIGCETLEQLTCYSEKELLALHGFGPKALGIISNLLKEKGLSYKEEE